MPGHGESRGRRVPAMVVSTCALLVTLGSGAYAAIEVDKGDIRRDAVRSKHIKRQGVRSADVKDQGLRAKDLSKGALARLVGESGPRGPAGSRGPTGPRGDPGAEGPRGPAGGARAYGLIDNFGQLSRSKNVIGVSPQGPNTYCVELAPEIDADGAVLVVAPLHSISTSSAFELVSHVEFDAAGGCGGNALAVATFVYDGDGVDDNDGSGNSGGDELIAENEGVVFVVP